MSLEKRRRMQGGDKSGPLYPLVPGIGYSSDGAYRVTVTSDGHIVRYNDTRKTPNKTANLRDINRYQYTTYCSTWFTLRKGQTVTFEASSLPSMRLRLYLANTGTVYKELTNITKTLTFVVEEDAEIGCVAFNTSAAVNAGTTAEFDIALYVDGRRYF